MEIEQLTGARLGKAEYVHDERTPMLARFFAPVIPTIKKRSDFDKGRAPFPLRMFANDAYGNCVKVGQVNQLMRLERLETRRTLKVSDEDVIEEYRRERVKQFGPPPPMSPGDARDDGLFVNQNLGSWRRDGWALTPNRNYKISAYGELDPANPLQLRQAMYLLHGVHFGFWLPRAAQRMPNFWDYNGETGPDWQPGSWGGHLVYGKKYDTGKVYVITWGREIPVSDRFIEKYCDEAWAVVDDFNSWRTKQVLDLGRLRDYLRDIGARGIE